MLTMPCFCFQKKLYFSFGLRYDRVFISQSTFRPAKNFPSEHLRLARRDFRDKAQVKTVNTALKTTTISYKTTSTRFSVGNDLSSFHIYFQQGVFSKKFPSIPETEIIGFKIGTLLFRNTKKILMLRFIS